MKIDLRYPQDFFLTLKSFNYNDVSPCSVLFNDSVVGGFIFNISIDDLTFFEITPDILPQPHFKFRMLNFESIAYAIEIILVFENDKILKFHLNPTFPIIKSLFNILISNHKISFHFYNNKTEQIASCFTDLNIEEVDWLVRNLKLIKTLLDNGLHTSLICNLTERIEPNDRVFKFYDNKNVKKMFLAT